MKSKSFSYGSESTSSSGSNSPSPPPSPRRHLTASISRRRLFRSKSQSTPSLINAIFFRRNLRYLVLLSLLYVSGLLMCVGPFSAFVFQPSPPGSVYRSHELFRKLWGDIQSDNSSALDMSAVWNYKRRLKQQKPCPNVTVTAMQHPKIEAGSSGAIGYLIVEANGGLNQQRSAICNAVALAGFLNAILVIPRLEFNNVWRDTSLFGDLFDEDHFTTTLSGHVQVIKELPEELMQKYDYNVSNIPNLRVPAWASVNYYSSVVSPILQKKGVIRIAPFANRLAMSVPPQVQFLRCLANYRALRFSSSITVLALKLVSRMVEKSAMNGGKYVSIHLRFEKDMVAFSCCVYDGGRAERYEMDLVRETSWRGKFKRTDRVISPGFNRIDGKCPLTPLEVGIILRGMGFDNSTSIYLASGKIYQEERHLAPLLKMFPLLHTKESIATPDELAPFMGYSSRLAALDYTVCLFSEVFVTTQGGNFPHFLMGHRRFLFDGHAKTIIPDKRELAVLLQNMSISWNALKDRMKLMLTDSDRKGIMVPRVKKFNRKTSIYTFPLPECSCLQKSHNSKFNLIDTVNSSVSQLNSAR